METMQLACVSQAVAAPAQAMWAVLTDFGRPQRLASSIERCSLMGEGVGAIRTVESARGLRIYERLLECDPKTFRFRYEVLDSGDMPFAGVKRYLATVVLEPHDAHSATVTWRAEGCVDGPLAPVADYLETLYRRAIDNLAAIAIAEARPS